ncbi:hypothetical protein EON80_10650, partial [bacterium]
MNQKTVLGLVGSAVALSLTGQAAIAQDQTLSPADLAALRSELAELREEVRKLKETAPPVAVTPTPAPTGTTTGTATPVATAKPATKWYDNINIRGYAQVRYN